jgi:hypothetical protein
MKRQTVPPAVARTVVSQMDPRPGSGSAVRRRLRPWANTLGVALWVLAATLLTPVVGCSKGTYLVLRFEGATLPAVYGIRVSLTVHTADGTIRQSVGILPSATNTSAIPLPTSAAFKLDDQSGTLDILAEALDLEKKTIAKQTVSGSAIHHGQTWTVTLAWDATTSGKLTAAPETAPEPLDESGATEDATFEASAIDPAWH